MSAAKPHGLSVHGPYAHRVTTVDLGALGGARPEGLEPPAIWRAGRCRLESCPEPVPRADESAGVHASTSPTVTPNSSGGRHGPGPYRAVRNPRPRRAGARRPR